VDARQAGVPVLYPPDSGTTVCGVSYDLIFLRRAADQSWSEVFDADDDDDDDDTALPDADQWRRIVVRAQDELGDIEAIESDEFYEIDHEPTSIQLTLFRNSGEMNTPYGAVGAGAVRTLTAMYQLAAIVEAETGLECYDPQVELPLRDAAADHDLGLASFELAGRLLGRRTETD
jgi:hypothetical protein